MVVKFKVVGNGENEVDQHCEGQNSKVGPAELRESVEFKVVRSKGEQETNAFDGETGDCSDLEETPKVNLRHSVAEINVVRVMVDVTEAVARENDSFLGCQ